MKCPICKKDSRRSAIPDLPFCSERCRLIDLGNWASEKYVISTPAEPADLEPHRTATRTMTNSAGRAAHARTWFGCGYCAVAPGHRWARSPHSPSRGAARATAALAPWHLPSSQLLLALPASGRPDVTAPTIGAARTPDRGRRRSARAVDRRSPGPRCSTGRPGWPHSCCSACSISGNLRPCASWSAFPAASGIVADDVMAGVYGALVLFLAGWFNLY